MPKKNGAKFSKMELIDLQISTHLELNYEKRDPDIPEWFFFFKVILHWLQIEITRKSLNEINSRFRECFAIQFQKGKTEAPSPTADIAPLA